MERRCNNGDKATWESHRRPLHRPFPRLRMPLRVDMRTFCSDHFRNFRLFVDLADGQVEADVSAIIAAQGQSSKNG